MYDEIVDTDLNVKMIQAFSGLPLDKSSYEQIVSIHKKRENKLER
jgi:hypothetical protein